MGQCPTQVCGTFTWVFEYTVPVLGGLTLSQVLQVPQRL